MGVPGRPRPVRALARPGRYGAEGTFGLSGATPARVRALVPAGTQFLLIRASLSLSPDAHRAAPAAGACELTMTLTTMGAQWGKDRIRSPSSSPAGP